MSQENFTVGFVVKSVYHRPIDINIILSVGTNETESKIQTLRPNEEIISQFNVTIPTVGLHKVKISTTPMTINRKNEIYFWVERF